MTELEDFISKIDIQLVDLFIPEVRITWWNTPKSLLYNKTPREYIKTVEDAEEVLSLLEYLGR